MTYEWSDLEDSILDDETYASVYREQLAAFRSDLIFPELLDVVESSISFLRMQQIFELGAKDLSDGWILLNNFEGKANHWRYKNSVFTFDAFELSEPCHDCFRSD